MRATCGGRVCVGVCLRVCMAQRVANGPMFSHRYTAPCFQALRDSGEPVASMALSQRARNGLVSSPGLDEGGRAYSATVS